MYEGLSSMKRTPTLPCGTPVDGIVDQDAGAVPVAEMRPKPFVVGSYVVPPRSTVIFVSSPQLFAMKIAKHGDEYVGCRPAKNAGVATMKSQPIDPCAAAAA